jgi:type VI secretion system protein ImpA
LSDLDTLTQQAEAWLQPLDGDDGPCGPDLEYDNAFLELSKAAEGKPETQFDKGAPPDWRQVRGLVEALFDRARDLRVAVLWARAQLSLVGVGALVPGLHLINGLMRTHWETLHPVPDPSDNDPYARANALAVLPQMEGLLGDLLGASLVRLKGVGDIRLRDVEVALGNLPAREEEPSYTREHLERMFGAGTQEVAGLRATLLDAQQGIKDLGALMDEHFGSGSSAENKPLAELIAHALQLVPAPAEDVQAEGEGDADDSEDGGSGGTARASKAGLSGSVNNRADAVRAIELVCAYLERYEPTNPAQLFLRRASGLLERNFLELLKELAPGSLDEVARIVGVDPNSVGPTES